LSIVFGTPTIGMPASDSRCAAASVPSPPIAMSASTPPSAITSATRSAPPNSNGLVRDDPRMVPPCFEMPITCGRPSGTVSFSTSPFQPQR
jgi:hypothetical protein